VRLDGTCKKKQLICKEKLMYSKSGRKDKKETLKKNDGRRNLMRVQEKSGITEITQSSPPFREVVRVALFVGPLFWFYHLKDKEMQT